MKKMCQNLKCKLSIFLVLAILFHLLFWYYVSSFCAVYKNTQLKLFLDSIISIFHSLFIYPFLIFEIMCATRIIALNYKKKCLFQFSNFLGNFLL